MRIAQRKKEEFLEKDRKRTQAARLREQECGVSSEVKAHRNKLNRERVSKFRPKKNHWEEQYLELQDPCPRKKNVIVKQLAEWVGLIKSSLKPKTVTSEETIKKS